MPSSSALPETLKSITATKIAELGRQQRTFEEKKQHIFSAAKEKANPQDKVDVVLNGSSRLNGIPESDSGENGDYGDRIAYTDYAGDLQNKQLFVNQAKLDQSFSEGILREIGEGLENRLTLESIRHEHALFFSNLVTDWLSNPQNPSDEAKASHAGDTSMEDSASFEEVGRKEMHEQRAQWESLVFSESKTNADTIKTYLDDLFWTDKTARLALEDLRKKFRITCTDLQFGGAKFSIESLKLTIKGLLRTDLLSDDKNAILREFSRNKEVLSEVVDVLNMRLDFMEEWRWTNQDGISLEMRRQLNGKYRVFMDEDVLDGLLLHRIGMQFAVLFRTVFTDFFNSRAWRQCSKSISKLDRDRRSYFLGESKSIIGRYNVATNGVQSRRRETFAKDYFLTQLPIEEAEGARAYDDDSDDGAPPSTDRKGPLEIKHSLLHLLITEGLIATKFEGQFCAVRSDFKWFGPALPHTTIFAVLEYFGVSDSWLNFFETFLKAPLKFVQDGENAQIQVRRRGVPMSHVLSDCFGESVLFVMDYAVNRRTNGQFLYRLHDDFWLWGSQDSCQRGWRAMTEFASTMGIEFNEEKTGTVRYGPTPNQIDSLPKGEIRWGFLVLDDKKCRFVIDQAQVDEHIGELQRQLAACQSIFAWVQAWNSYLARFFSNNFGKSAVCFGREHLDMLLETFARIQSKLFPTGSVTDYLRGVIREKFSTDRDLPDGFFYWPVEMGGLELKNPSIELLAMRERIRQTPDFILQRASDLDDDEFVAAKEKFEKESTGFGLSGHISREARRAIEQSVAGSEGFMALEEFSRYREETSTNLLTAYNRLLEIPKPIHVNPTTEVTAGLGALERTAARMGTRTIGTWGSMTAYWKWIVTLYCTEMVKKYGGVAIVDQGKVPLGVVNVLRSGRVKWLG